MEINAISQFEKKIERFIDKHDLCTPNDSILVGLSGGVDSVVLSYLLYKFSYKIGIAHCNFDLRIDSKKDQHFARMIAEAWNAPFYQTTFATKVYAKQHKLGIQEAARNLRYDWFKEIMKIHDYKLLATAHHFDDQIETVFINMSRGTGITGLGGMKPKRNHLIRPLLSVSKEEIETYARKIKLPYREDASNRSNKYRRNFFRNKIIPKIQKKIPGFKKRMGDNILIWQKSARLLDGFFKEQLNQIKKSQDGSQILETEKIEASLKQMIFFEWLYPFGFNYTQTTLIGDILKKNESGRKFYSKSHKVIVDRKKIILTARIEAEIQQVEIQKEQSVVDLPDGSLEIKLMAFSQQKFPQSTRIEYIDATLLTFPLLIRKWKSGDQFFPFGMQGKSQKIKKYFTNEKMSLHEKEAQWLLTTSNEIVWVVGRRLDHRFRINKNTLYCYRMQWRPSNDDL